MSGTATFSWLRPTAKTRRLRDDIRELNRRVLEGNEALLANQRLERLLDMKKNVKVTNDCCNGYW